MMILVEIQTQSSLLLITLPSQPEDATAQPKLKPFMGSNLSTKVPPRPRMPTLLLPSPVQEEEQ